ncbi:hypothetical protein ANN_25725 [Periplaneta americana]|uniref:Uncharacterized protein n=1 Tax=Periplaneta americana TaxID=6978 RepID=A0ABQ8S4D3_PERAM|nr:hypothetical protein ANN_25725 [Periplaneta americana]
MRCQERYPRELAIYLPDYSAEGLEKVSVPYTGFFDSRLDDKSFSVIQKNSPDNATDFRLCKYDLEREFRRQQNDVKAHLNAIDLARDRTRNLGHRRPALYQRVNQVDDADDDYDDDDDDDYYYYYRH